MSITTIIILVAAAIGIGWAYPRLPSPWNFVLVGLVAIVCIIILLNFSGVHTGINLN
jgi:uncharacterized membrane protein